MALFTKIKEWFSKPPAKSEAKQEAAEKPAMATPRAAGWSAQAHHINLQPLVSERSMNMQANNVVVFRVDPQASKGAVAAAVQEKYGVKVLAVRTANFMPKARRRGATVGSTRFWKKAYVTVSDIASLNLAP